MPIYTPIFIDTFQRANESPLNPANWTADSEFPTDTLQIVSHQCEAVNATDLFGAEQYTGLSLPNDQYVEITVGLFGGAQSALFALGRSAGTYDDSYLARVTSGGSLVLLKSIGGSETTLGTATGPAIQAGDVLRLEMFGSTISLLYNGVS